MPPGHSRGLGDDDRQLPPARRPVPSALSGGEGGADPRLRTRRGDLPSDWPRVLPVTGFHLPQPMGAQGPVRGRDLQGPGPGVGSVPRRCLAAGRAGGGRAGGSLRGGRARPVPFAALQGPGREGSRRGGAVGEPGGR